MHLPGPGEVRSLLVDLLDKPVELRPATPLAPGPQNPCSVAVYVDDSLTIRAVIACDLAFSTYVGGAIGLVPPATAAGELATGALSDGLRDNLFEVLNIAASMFNVADAPHVRLHDLHRAGDPLPPDLLARCLSLGRREDLSIDIGGYGTGACSVILTV